MTAGRERPNKNLLPLVRRHSSSPHFAPIGNYARPIFPLAIPSGDGVGLDIELCILTCVSQPSCSSSTPPTPPRASGRESSVSVYVQRDRLMMDLFEIVCRERHEASVSCIDLRRDRSRSSRLVHERLQARILSWPRFVEWIRCFTSHSRTVYVNELLITSLRANTMTKSLDASAVGRVRVRDMVIRTVVTHSTNGVQQTCRPRTGTHPCPFRIGWRTHAFLSRGEVFVQVRSYEDSQYGVARIS